MAKLTSIMRMWRGSEELIRYFIDNYGTYDAHNFNFFQNDLENIIPFVLMGGLYLTTNPALGTAKLLFRTFSIARIMHSVVYLWAVSKQTKKIFDIC